MQIDEKLKKLNRDDTYSLILYALFTQFKSEEYSAISQLIYVLDSDNLLRLCDYFGGMTITIPTLDELKYMICALQVFEDVNINNIELEESINHLNVDKKDIVKIKQNYASICKLMEELK